MSKQNLFVPQIKNHVSRNAFDLSQRRIYSAKCGEILPCFVQGCLPGDKFKINASTFSRTAPLNTAAFARMKQYFNFYFVPYRLLYRDFPSFVIQQSKSSKSANSISNDLTVNEMLPHVTEHTLEQITQSWFAPNRNHRYSLVSVTNSFTTDGTAACLLNPFYLNRMTQTRKLLQYLGYYKLTQFVASGVNDDWHANNSPLSLFPLMAYQKVYNDFYRFSQWENESASTYNVDYLSGSSSMLIPVHDLFNTSKSGFWFPRDPILTHGSTMFDMRYVNFTKDTFLGVVPTSQFGAVSTVNPSVINDAQGRSGLTNVFLRGYSQSFDEGETINAKWDMRQANLPNSADLSAAVDPDADATVRPSLTLINQDGKNIFDTFKSSFDILTLRAAQAKQKFMEVTLSNNSDYKSQIEAHFNVNVSSLMSGLCDYIGGFSSDLSIDTVTNTNLADGNEANYAANGTMSGDGNFTFEAREHGLIIGVSYILPFIDWSVQGYDFENLRVNFDDFALPEYDRLGYEEVDPRLLIGNLNVTDYTGREVPTHLGYGPRYYDYKTNYDIVLGDFNTAQGGSKPIFTVNLNSQTSFQFPYDAQYDENGDVITQLFDNFTNGLITDLAHNHVTPWSFKVSPTLLNNIFTVSTGLQRNSDGKYVVNDDIIRDQFYNVLNLNVSVVRNLDRLGLPY